MELSGRLVAPAINVDKGLLEGYNYKWKGLNIMLVKPNGIWIQTTTKITSLKFTKYFNQG